MEVHHLLGANLCVRPYFFIILSIIIIFRIMLKSMAVQDLMVRMTVLISSMRVLRSTMSKPML